MRLVIKRSASPYRLLTHFGSVIQRFGSHSFFFFLFFIFDFIWVHNGERGESGVGFSWLASKVVSSLKFIYYYYKLSSASPPSLFVFVRNIWTFLYFFFPLKPERNMW